MEILGPSTVPETSGDVIMRFDASLDTHGWVHTTRLSAANDTHAHLNELDIIADLFVDFDTDFDLYFRALGDHDIMVIRF